MFIFHLSVRADLYAMAPRCVWAAIYSPGCWDGYPDGYIRTGKAQWPGKLLVKSAEQSPEPRCGLKTFMSINGHYSDVIMGAMASQITSLMIVYPTDYSGADQRTHQSSASLVFVRGIHRWPVNSPHKGPVTWKMFPLDDVIKKRRSALFTSENYDTRSSNSSHTGQHSALYHIVKCFAMPSRSIQTTKNV